MKWLLKRFYCDGWIVVIRNDLNVARLDIKYSSTFLIAAMERKMSRLFELLHKCTAQCTAIMLLRLISLLC